MLTRWRVAALVAIGIVLASAQVGAHQNRVRLPLSSNTCRDGSPERIWVVNGADATDCSTGGSTFEVECCCIDGTWDQCPGGTSSGSSDSFKTQNTPSGTDPVADSATDTLNWTAGTGITITGDSSTDTITIAALRLASFDNPRESSDAYDCEFDSSICSWTWSNPGGGSSEPVAGTVNPVASISGDPIYDLASWPGRLLVQSDESTGKSILLSRSVTLDTNATIVASVSIANRSFSAAEGSIYLWLDNAADTNEAFSCGAVNASGTGLATRRRIENNGTVTAGSGGIVTESAPFPRVFLWIFKLGNDYTCGFSFSADGIPEVFASFQTKTGVTTLDRLSLYFVTADEEPSIVWSVDWVRYYDTNTIAVLNE